MLAGDRFIEEDKMPKMSKNIDLETSIKQTAQKSVSRILTLPNKDNFRCHEFARLIRQDLVKEGYDRTVVKDGIVFYDVDYFIEKYMEMKGLGDQESRELLEACVDNNKKERGPIMHSWCEFKNIVIDYQNMVNLSRYTPLTGAILMVHNRNEFDGKVRYLDHGREFRFLWMKFIKIHEYTFRLRV